VQIEHHAGDLRVSHVVEVVHADLEAYLADQARMEQDRAEHGHLGVDRAR
jgi:hypothetical protein